MIQVAAVSVVDGSPRSTTAEETVGVTERSNLSRIADERAQEPRQRVPGIIGVSSRELVVVFLPQTPDRTAAIRGIGPSPAPYLRESALTAERLGATCLAVACNTAHQFLPEALGSPTPIDLRLINMIEESARAVAASGVRQVGILASSGTIEAGLYQRALQEVGVGSLTPQRHAFQGPGSSPMASAHAPRIPDGVLDEGTFDDLVARLVASAGEQEGLIGEAIFGPSGIKAGFTDGVSRQLMEEAARRLVERGADALLLGCTEIPLVLRGSETTLARRSVKLVDPTQVVADALPPPPAVPGILGGLGPEATVDMLVKLMLPPTLTETLRAIIRATEALLGAARDQDHLRMMVVVSPDPGLAARRLAAAGADFLVMPASDVNAAAEARHATSLDVLSGANLTQLAGDAVRYAAGIAAER
jgi:aspartate racemase